VAPCEEAGRVNLEFRVRFMEAGPFFVQLDFYDPVINGRNFTEPLYINVEPVLVINERNTALRCKDLSILTVLSRCLGPIHSRWEDAYEQAAQLGYNAIHFTPIQKYGQSYSHYSIADQTTIDDYFFTDLDNEGDEKVSETLSSH